MKISGLASGIDTETIIRDMMKAHRIPLSKITQKKQYTEWILKDYRDIGKNLRLQENKFSDSMLRQNTFMQKTLNISNPNAIGMRALSASNEFSGTIEVEQLATQATIISGEITFGTDQSTKSKLSELGISGTGSIKITAPGKDGVAGIEKEITFDAETDTVDSLLRKINSQSDVTAFYDSHSKKIAFTAKHTGAGDIQIDASAAGNLGATLGLTAATTVSGKNAKFTFNGLQTERASNTFQISGYEITLKEATTGPVTFSSAPDVDKVVDSVKQFVEDYNKMIEELTKKVNEPKYRNFHPLSSEEKAEMKENEIKLWEEKAMSGTLRRDPTIQNMLTKMRTALSGTVEGTNGPIRLSDIGIKPMSDYTANGKLEIDETKLREAIAADPNKVYEVLGKGGKGNEQGLVGRVNGAMAEARSAIAQRAGTSDAINDSFTLGRSIKSMDKQIERFNERLKLVEDRYWKQFTAMERAIQRANEQSAKLMSSLGGMM